MSLTMLPRHEIIERCANITPEKAAYGLNRWGRQQPASKRRRCVKLFKDASGSQCADDLVSALISMGMDNPHARARDARSRMPNGPMQQLIRLALHSTASTGMADNNDPWDQVLEHANEAVPVLLDELSYKDMADLAAMCGVWVFEEKW